MENKDIGVGEQSKESPETQFKVKVNCKTCYGRGFVTMTRPTGKKEWKKGRLKSTMVSMKTMCHCVTEVLPEKRIPVITDEEQVVPKVNKIEATVVNGMKQYAYKVVPDGER